MVNELNRQAPNEGKFIVNEASLTNFRQNPMFLVDNEENETNSEGNAIISELFFISCRRKSFYP